MNRLEQSSSPYLRQHKDNPVDWYEWGDDAFVAATESDRPILLSIGYSSCHWCHVMAHESFENPEVAATMNQLFVNVKVDREERPDIDAVYMDAVQALTGRGGWPMTVFLSPDGHPFFGGTYFPREQFVRLLHSVDDAWRNKRADLQQNIDALAGVMDRTGALVPLDDFDTSHFEETVLRELRKSFDSVNGGFGSAPKFPNTFATDVILREFVRSGDESLRTLVTLTLDAMACGGIYDHIGGGFSRYSVDEEWLVPHFEKMLYDQALLARTYIHAWKALGHVRYFQVASETIDYVLSSIRHPLGGFFSAEDADSPAQDGTPSEGAFYTWTPGELDNVLGEWSREAATFWDISEEGNFEGRSIPNRLHARPELGRPDIIERCRRSLSSARNERPRPGLDDKVITEWNAMFLATLAEAALLADNERWKTAAVANGVFLIEHLRDHEGTWRRSWRAGSSPPARHAAVANDLANVTDAFTRLYELTGNERWLLEARDTADALISGFWDTANGGVFTVSHTGEKLVARQKDIMDNSTPSANSAAAVAMFRLSAVLGDRSYADVGRGILRLVAGVFEQAPTAFCNALLAFDLSTRGTTEVVVPGTGRDFVREYVSTWRPSAVLAHGAPMETPLWEGRTEGNAYVCHANTCLVPATTPGELARQLATSHPT